jgi:hypothetical protein
LKLIERPFVNLAPVSDSNQMQMVFLQIELVDDSVISDTQSKCVHALHSIVRERLKIRAECINALLNSFLNIPWQSEKALVKLRGIDLRGRAAHEGSRFADAITALGNVFGSRFDFRFEFFLQLKPVFEKIFEPFTELLLLVWRKRPNVCFDFFQRFHATKLKYETKKVKALSVDVGSNSFGVAARPVSLPVY